jgi:hypothetical protein
VSPLFFITLEEQVLACEEEEDKEVVACDEEEC